MNDNSDIKDVYCYIAFLLSSFDFLYSTVPVFPHACSVTNSNSRDILTLNYANAVSKGMGAGLSESNRYNRFDLQKQ